MSESLKQWLNSWREPLKIVQLSGAGPSPKMTRRFRDAAAFPRPPLQRGRVTIVVDDPANQEFRA